jgi:TusA-related sulfurtransferase
MPTSARAPRPEPGDVLDTLGLYCPVPIWETAKRIKGMRPGQVLEVLSDDEQIERDLPAWCNRTGHELMTMTKDGQVYRARVRKKG